MLLINLEVLGGCLSSKLQFLTQGLVLSSKLLDNPFQLLYSFILFSLTLIEPLIYLSNLTKYFLVLLSDKFDSLCDIILHLLIVLSHLLHVFIEFRDEGALHLLDKAFDCLDALSHQLETTSEFIGTLGHLGKLRIVLGGKQGELRYQRVVILLILLFEGIQIMLDEI